MGVAFIYTNFEKKCENWPKLTETDQNWPGRKKLTGSEKMLIFELKTLNTLWITKMWKSKRILFFEIVFDSYKAFMKNCYKFKNVTFALWKANNCFSWQAKVKCLQNFLIARNKNFCEWKNKWFTVEKWARIHNVWLQH